jgi:hypothetical protein
MAAKEGRTMYHFTPHQVHYTKAIAFIQYHGHFAAITKDGLLAMATVWSPSFGKGIADEDHVVEVPMVFETSELGFVDSAKVREWLGY